MMAFQQMGVFWLISATVLHISSGQGTGCQISDGWLPSGPDKCLLVSTEQGPDTKVWEEARDQCTSLNSGAYLASLPTDVHDNNLAGRLSPGETYWVGMRVPNTNPNNLTWLDGSPETRKSHFIYSSNLTGSPPYLCGHVVLSIVTLQPLQLKLTWTLDDCSILHSYVCVMDDAAAKRNMRQAPGTAKENTDAKANAYYSTAAGIASNHAKQLAIHTEGANAMHKFGARSRAMHSARKRLLRLERDLKAVDESRQAAVAIQDMVLSVFKLCEKLTDHRSKENLPKTVVILRCLENTRCRSSCALKRLNFQENVCKIVKPCLDSVEKKTLLPTLMTLIKHTNCTLLFVCQRLRNLGWKQLTEMSSRSRRGKRSVSAPLILSTQNDDDNNHNNNGQQMSTHLNINIPPHPPPHHHNTWHPSTFTPTQNAWTSSKVAQTSSGTAELSSSATLPVIGTSVTSAAMTVPTMIHQNVSLTTIDFLPTTAMTMYSTAAFSSVRKRLKCAKSSSPVDCLIDAVNKNLSQSPSESSDSLDTSLMETSEMLMDELSHFVVATPNIDHVKILSDFLHVVDALLQLSSETRGSSTKGSIEEVLVKAEEFLHNVMTTAADTAFTQDFRLTLVHIDLLIYQSSAGALKGKKLLMKSGAIIIDDVHFQPSHNTTAKTMVSALVLHVPKTEVWLSQEESNVRALVVSPVLSLSAVVGRIKASLSHTFTLAVQPSQNSTNQTVCGFQNNSGSEEIWDIHGCEAISYSSSPQSQLYQTSPGVQLPSSTNNSLPNNNNNNNSSSTNASVMYSMTNNSVDNNDDSNSGLVECRCNHTTNFAVLMQVVSVEISPKDEMVLSIITYIGCSITLITQVMAITVFTCIRSLNSERVCVHRNLCISIMAAQIAFIAGIKAVNDKIVCAFVAVILHYFYLASFVWMLVEGLHLYSKVVRVFGTENSRIIYYVCFGWGMPFVLVAVSAAVDWDGYGTEDSCWLSTERATIWAFVGPAVAIMIVNLIILVIVLRIVVTSAKNEKHEDYDHIRAGVKATLFLIPLLGLTWMFGLAAVNKQLVAFQYIFAILNSLQGFFIFLCHCVFNTEVRSTLRRMKEKRSLQKGEFVLTSSSTNGRPSSSDSRSPSGGHVTMRESTSPVFRKVNQVAPSPTQLDNSAKQELRKDSKHSGDITLMYI